MNDVDWVLDKIIPEKILDCQFKDMPFTLEMLEVYLAVNGERSLLEISRRLSIDLARLIIYIKKLARVGIVKIHDINNLNVYSEPKPEREFCYRGVFHYK